MSVVVLHALPDLSYVSASPVRLVSTPEYADTLFYSLANFRLLRYIVITVCLRFGIIPSEVLRVSLKQPGYYLGFDREGFLNLPTGTFNTLNGCPQFASLSIAAKLLD